MIFTAVIELDPVSNLYVATVPGVPGAHTQAASLDELRVNLKEVLELCREEQKDFDTAIQSFVGIQQIELA